MFLALLHIHLSSLIDKAASEAQLATENRRYDHEPYQWCVLVGNCESPEG